MRLPWRSAPCSEVNIELEFSTQFLLETFVWLQEEVMATVVGVTGTTMRGDEDDDDEEEDKDTLFLS